MPILIWKTSFWRVASTGEHVSKPKLIKYSSRNFGPKIASGVTRYPRRRAQQIHSRYACGAQLCAWQLPKVNNVDSRVDRRGLLTSTAIMHKLHKLIAHNTRPTECTVQSMIICTLWPLRGQLSMFRKGNSSSRINFWKYRLWCCISTKYFFYLRGTVVSIDETKENKQYQPAQRFHFIFLTRKFRIIYDFFFRLLHLSSSRSLLGWVHHARPPEGSDRFITSKKRTLWNNKFQHN